MLQRRDVIEKIIALLSENIDVNLAEKAWFVDLRRQGGWRLSKIGLEAFKLANLQFWSVDLGKCQVNKALLLQMNQKIKWPYYICFRTNKIILFSDKDAVIANLHSNLQNWLESL